MSTSIIYHYIIAIIMHAYVYNVSKNTKPFAVYGNFNIRKCENILFVHMYINQKTETNNTVLSDTHVHNLTHS